MNVLFNVCQRGTGQFCQKFENQGVLRLQGDKEENASDSDNEIPIGLGRKVSGSLKKART